MELVTRNIRVNAIAPGGIDTDMNSNLSEEEIKELENQRNAQEKIYDKQIEDFKKFVV